MAYEAQKDKVLLDAGSIPSNGGEIAARFVSYDGGPAKLALVKLYTTKAGKQKTSPIGRVPVEDVPALVKLVGAAYTKWDAANGTGAFSVDA
jgi:hypothetical protein